jgi:hypothetical protein
MAEKAKRTRRNVMLEPMSPYERRIIHDEVSGIEGVTTSSVGSDNNRRVVIFFERRPADARVQETPAEPIPETATLPEIEEESEIEVEIETEIGTDEGADVSSISDEEAYDDSEDDSENDPA